MRPAVEISGLGFMVFLKPPLALNYKPRVWGSWMLKSEGFVRLFVLCIGDGTYLKHQRMPHDSHRGLKPYEP